MAWFLALAGAATAAAISGVAVNANLRTPPQAPPAPVLHAPNANTREDRAPTTEQPNANHREDRLPPSGEPNANTREDRVTPTTDEPGGLTVPDARRR